MQTIAKRDHLLILTSQVSMQRLPGDVLQLWRYDINYMPPGFPTIRKGRKGKACSKEDTGKVMAKKYMSPRKSCFHSSA